MGLIAHMGLASGRAKCKICGKLIVKDSKQINIIGYQTGGAIHNHPDDCIKGRV